MKEVSKQPRGSATWIALALVVAMLGGIAWIVSSYIRGNSPVVVPISPEAIEAIKGPPSRQETYAAVEHDWKVSSGPYSMEIHQPENSTSYEYHFMILLSSAFTGKDLRLMMLAHNLTANSVLAREAGAPENQIKQLNDSLGERLRYEPLRVSDESARKCESLWEKLRAEKKSKDREATHDELVYAIQDACTAARQASQVDFAATVAEVRGLIPQEQQYEENITIARNKRAAEYFSGTQQQTAAERHPPASTQTSTRP